MVVRRVKMSDKRQLVQLRMEFFRVGQANLSREQANFRKYIDKENQQTDSEDMIATFLSNPQNIIFVAEKNKSLIGYIVGEIKNRKYKIFNKEGYVEHWFVLEKYQHQGVGIQLFNSMVHEFINNGCSHIALDTHTENQKARQIYKHLGFTERLVVMFRPLPLGRQ